MKRGDEALNASSLQFLSSVKRFVASSLCFFLSVKRFIAVVFYGKPSFSSFNASSPLLFKLTLPTSAKKSTPRVFITGESRLPCVFTTGESRFPGVFTTGKLRLAGIFITGESFWTPGSHFTDFKVHTTIFKGSIILKIVCRLL